jgi:S1-C subfamily serine protease
VSRARAAVVCAAVAVAGCGQSKQRADPVVVRVELDGATSAAQVATGFAIAPARVVTVSHVLEPGRRLRVRTGGRVLRGRVLRSDLSDDLAVVAVPGLRGVSVPRFHRVSSGGTQLQILVRRGGRTARIAATLVRPVRATLRTPNAPARTRPALELRAHVALGDSGAPVVDRDGRVAGVLFARLSNGRATAYAVDASALETVLNNS